MAAENEDRDRAGSPAPERPVDEAAGPWEPEPIPEDAFLDETEEGRININRAPLDRVSGVVFKRAANIKRVRYDPPDPAPEMPPLWQGEGAGVVRWLFSELPGMEEGLLTGCTFALMQDLRLEPGAATGQRAHPGVVTLLYVIKGEGMLHHRPSTGSPVVARPLRPGDALMVEGDERYRLMNTQPAASLQVIVVGLRCKR